MRATTIINLFAIVWLGTGATPAVAGDCSDYIDLTGLELPIIVDGNTAGATNGFDRFSRRPDCWENTWRPLSCQGPDVIYRWTCPAAGRYTISLNGSSYDTCLQLFDFTCPIEPVYPDDYICGNDNTFISAIDAELFAMPFTTGQEILIVVDGFAAESGPYRLTLSKYVPAADLDVFISDIMDSTHIAGLAACGITGTDITWTGAHGHADLEHGIPVADTTLFVVASVSKPVTGTALMQLWERGSFELDDDINDHLPFEVRNPLHPDSAISFHMLLTHSSGIDDNWDILDTLVTWGEDSPLDLQQFLSGYLTPGGAYYDADNYDDWSPGDRYDYSNVGATLVGYLVEQISGQRFEDYSQDSLFAPLGMDATSWFLAGVDSSNVAVPYDWTGAAHVRYPHWGTPFYPASQLRTSTLQLARFLAAFMQCGEIGGVRILDCPTVELMTSVQDPDINVNSGLFWYRMHYGGRSLWGHAGSYYGCITHMFHAPDEDTGVIVLTSGENFAAVSMVMHEIFEHVTATTSVAGDDEGPGRRLRLMLYQNHPNPFNPTTTLRYSLTRSARVRLSIYDPLGRMLAMLHDGVQQPGDHRAVWDAAEVGSGIYFARIESGDAARTIKLVLVK